MRMMFATPCEDYKPNDVLVRAMDRIFILHADHEQNALHLDGPPGGLVGHQPVRGHRRWRGCLWGPAHGGANEACLTMLEDIQKMGGVARSASSSAR